MCKISAAAVKELRELTNISMMECKRALEEAKGDKEKSIKILRERGLAIASKKASRAANEGLIASVLLDDGAAGSLIEVNCETDFVARNEAFQSFVTDLAQRVAADDSGMPEAAQEDLTVKITETGENIVFNRHTRYERSGPGRVASYIHHGAKVGVLIEVGCGKEETTAADEFAVLVKDLTLHIAACEPQFLDSDEVPEDVIDSEREIYKKQVEGKPENIIEKIIEGKLKKYFSAICMLEQGFVKDPDQSIRDLLTAQGKALDDTIEIRRFTRYQIGA